MISAAKQKEIQDLREERLKKVKAGRDILDKAQGEKRGLNAEEQAQWDAIMTEVDDLGARAKNMEKQARAEDGSWDASGKEPVGKGKKPGKDGKFEGDDDEPRSEEDEDEEDEEEDEDDDERSHKPRYIEVNGRRYLVVPRTKAKRSVVAPGAKATDGQRDRGFRRNPGESIGDFETRCRRSTREYERCFYDYMLRGEQAFMNPRNARAIQADSDILGGYLVAPQEFVARLIKFVNNYVFVRRKATIYTVKAAQSLGAPSLDTDPGDAVWTSELDTGNEDNAMAFGKRELTPHPLAKRLKISRKLLQLVALAGGFSEDNSVKGGNAEALVRDRLAYKFGVTEEKAFLLGNGANQPIGMFVASTRGISTARDIVTGSSTGFTADGLIAAKYNQKVQYWANMEWVFHRSALQLIRQLKDANGQYLWVPGGLGGEADTMLDIPVNMSEYAPNTFTTGQYVGLLGDMSFYWIADAENLEIVRLNELYAAANMIGFIARRELDGMPVLEEAFTRLKCN